MALIFLRSLIYSVLFYSLLVIWLIVAIPTFVMPRAAIMRVARIWSRQNTWLLRIISVTVASWSTAATLDISERDFVKAAELQGMRPIKVMAKEILPNLVSPITVEAGLRLTYSITIIAGLAFLGFGQPPPAANWGTMIYENRTGLSLSPWSVIVPAALIALLTIGINTFTDAFARVAIGVDRRPEEAALIDDLGPGPGQ